MSKHCGNCYVLRGECKPEDCITGNGPLNYKNWKSSSDVINKVIKKSNVIKRTFDSFIRFINNWST